MARDSKPIGTADEGAKELIMEIMGEELTGGLDIDSLYHIPDRGWVVLEFLKCDSVRPFDSHPNRYWYKNCQKFLTLDRLVTDLDGELLLVNYEDSREQFLVIEVEEMDRGGIQEETTREMTFEEFSAYFIGLNRAARGI